MADIVDVTNMRIEEVDQDPSVLSPKKLIWPDGSLVDNMDGTMSVDLTAGQELTGYTFVPNPAEPNDVLFNISNLAGGNGPNQQTTRQSGFVNFTGVPANAEFVKLRVYGDCTNERSGDNWEIFVERNDTILATIPIGNNAGAKIRLDPKNNTTGTPGNYEDSEYSTFVIGFDTTNNRVSYRIDESRPDTSNVSNLLNNVRFWVEGFYIQETAALPATPVELDGYTFVPNSTVPNIAIQSLSVANGSGSAGAYIRQSGYINLSSIPANAERVLLRAYGTAQNADSAHNWYLQIEKDDTDMAAVTTGDVLQAKMRLDGCFNNTGVPGSYEDNTYSTFVVGYDKTNSRVSYRLDETVTGSGATSQANFYIWVEGWYVSDNASLTSTMGNLVDINREVLSANKTLTMLDAAYQRLDPGGANRDIILPQTPTTGARFFIDRINTGGSGNLVIKATSGGAALITLVDDAPPRAEIVYDGVEWFVVSWQEDTVVYV